METRPWNESLNSIRRKLGQGAEEATNTETEQDPDLVRREGVLKLWLENGGGGDAGSKFDLVNEQRTKLGLTPYSDIEDFKRKKVLGNM